ncbi:hypothetical protein EDI_018180 [Entamoeba dispar SAW760]|uniref:Uncharacterized protein n=1 Tax=Entamoeba dispar (strain ATCC PRA-260 / SAW760) TaxID=370354 RepID=B0EGI0_ENTDS|nr:uncharacterized protein EDI_018180 [Entamoeba dispar SAW760]EDR26359.1 hypothetical protein EDI_018180 [Entamoeba dispar SAW760]|eukprot:EDR26359.1 hypothetical protein EDI_018180 [Entamoeba dispar SAW760]
MEVMSVFLLLILIPESNCLQIDSPCIIDTRVENIKFIGKKGIVGSKSQIAKLCYDDVPEKNRNVLAYSTHTSCYFPLPSFSQIFQGREFPRCGICIRLSGPSLKSSICTIVGATVMNVTTEEEKLSYLRTMFVDEEMFQHLSGFYNNYGEGSSLPVVAQVVNCPYKTVPSAVVKSIKEEGDNYNTEVILFNTNLIIDKIELKGSYYYLNATSCLFNLIVPKSFTSGILKLYDFVGDALALPFKLELSTIQTASSSLPGSLKDTPCYLRLETQILNTTEIVDPYFSWKLYVHSQSNYNEVIQVDLKNPTIHFDNEIYISLVYPYPVKISKHYSYLYSDYFINKPLVKEPEFKTFAFIDSIENSIETNCLNSFALNKQVLFENNYYRIKSQLSMKVARCYAQINNIVVHYITNQDNSVITFNKMFLYPINDLNFTECPIGTFQCSFEDECNPTNSTIEPTNGELIKNYSDGCVPFCGTCKFGFSCNKAAKCVRTISLNLRNQSFGTFLFVALLLIFII